tara:strand:- start:450 stop:989 length:540 start_codon:yes stop_codon:yes gene_type:complete
MLKLDGKTLRYDKAFTHNGISYPANWLRLTSLEEKQAIGIEEVADPVVEVWDQRFYWGVDNPKDLDDLKALWKQKQSEIAGSLLAPSDWRVIKARETGGQVPIDWFNYRRDVRSACNTRQTEIDNCSDVPALKELLFGAPTITRQQTDSEGNGVVDSYGNAIMETVINPAIATAWPTSI